MNKHSLTKIAHAYKNYQRENKFPYFRCLEEFGFTASTDYSYNRFLSFLKGLSAKRRQAVMRLGRAALKRKTLCSVINFLPIQSFNSSPGVSIKWVEPEQDLRKIPFIIDGIRKHSMNCLKSSIGESRKYFTDTEIICMVAEVFRENNTAKK